MLIYFHTHCFPDKIAERAILSLSKCSGNIQSDFDGTAQGLADKIKEYNMDYAVVLNIATNPKQQTAVNDFAISLKNFDTLISFGSVHPETDNVFDELVRIKNAGLKGIKFHPDYQDFYVDEERMFPIYEAIGELGLITSFHAGVDIGLPDPTHCTPQRLSKILPYFKGAPVIAAHMGGHMLWREVIEYLAGTDIYIDTSYCYSRMPQPWANEMVSKHGAEKFLFGSDMPWSSSGNEMRFVMGLDISDDKKDLILGKTAEGLLF